MLDSIKAQSWWSFFRRHRVPAFVVVILIALGLLNDVLGVWELLVELARRPMWLSLAALTTAVVAGGIATWSVERAQQAHRKLARVERDVQVLVGLRERQRQLAILDKALQDLEHEVDAIEVAYKHAVSVAGYEGAGDRTVHLQNQVTLLLESLRRLESSTGLPFKVYDSSHSDITDPNERSRVQAAAVTAAVKEARDRLRAGIDVESLMRLEDLDPPL